MESTTTLLSLEQAKARLNYNEWFDYAERVAASFARSYPGVERDDITQELHTLLIEKKDQFLEQDNISSYIKVSMKHSAAGFCKRERSAQMFWTDDYLYRPDDIRELLTEYYEQPTRAWVPEDAVSMRGDDDMACMADMANAVAKLPLNYREILDQKYTGEDVNDAKERQTLSRAIRRLTEILNNKRKQDMANHTGPGSRKVITNAAAMSRTKAVIA